MTVFVLMLNDGILGVYATEVKAHVASLKHWTNTYNPAYHKYGENAKDNGYFYRVYSYAVESEE